MDLKEAILTVGPRASGKTTFCKKALEIDPSIIFISRDEILISLFGKVAIDPYVGGESYVLDKIFEKIKEISESNPSLTMILDYFNGNSLERKFIIQKLRELGFDQVTAWYFTTAPRYVKEWFWKKPGIAKFSEMEEKKDQGYAFYFEDVPIKDYNTFWALVATIDTDGFDDVLRINPLESSPEDILNVKASLK